MHRTFPNSYHSIAAHRTIKTNSTIKMKVLFAVLLLAVVAIAAADVSTLNRPSNEYLAPHQTQQQSGSVAEGFGPEREYLPPTKSGEAAPAHSFGPDGYRYKNPSRF